VAVSGLVLNTGAFGGAVVPDEEGEVRGLVNVGMNFLYNPATTAFVNGEVRFGDEYFGVGGKVGVRVRLN
jgi:hypothetical protein